MPRLAGVATSILILCAPALAAGPSAEELKPGQVRIVGKYPTRQLKFGDRRSTFYLIEKGSRLRLRVRGPISLGLEVRGLEYQQAAFRLGMDQELEAEARLDLSPVEIRRLHFHVPEGTHQITMAAQATVLIHPIKIYDEVLKHETMVAWKQSEAKPAPPPAPKTAPGEMPPPEFSLPGDRRTSFAVLDLAASNFDPEVAEALRHAGRRLLGIAGDGTGTLAVSADREGAAVYVDNQNRGTLPMPPLLHVPAGRHLVRVAKDGFLDWRRDFYVNARETTAVWAELKAANKSWYEHWWVWTIAAAVLAGGGAATYFLVK